LEYNQSTNCKQEMKDAKKGGIFPPYVLDMKISLNIFEWRENNENLTIFG